MSPEYVTGLIALTLNMGAVGIAIYKLGRAVQKFESIGEKQAMEITELKNAVKEISGLVTKIAITSERQDNFATRLNRMEATVDDLRRGEGFILPLPGTSSK